MGGLCSLNPSLPQSKGSLYKNLSLSKVPTSPQSLKNIKLSQKFLFAVTLVNYSSSITVAVSQLIAVCLVSWQLSAVEVFLVSCYIVQQEKSPILNASVIKNKTKNNSQVSLMLSLKAQVFENTNIIQEAQKFHTNG